MNNSKLDGLYAAFDLGSYSIKAAVIEISNGKERLSLLEERKLKSRIDFPEDNDYRAYVVEVLSELADALPLKECRGISSIFANRELQVKVVELPSQIQQEQIENVLNWEAKKLLSPNYRDEPYTFSYRIIKQSPFVVCLSVIPDHLLTRYIDVFESAGIKLDNIYGDIFSAYSLKKIVDTTSLPALSLVNFGENGTHLQIFSSGEPRFYRFIPSGASELPESPTERDFEIYAQKIRFSFDYFRAISKLNNIDALFFMGGGTTIPEFMPFARSYFSPTKVGIVDISSGLDITPVLLAMTASLPPEERQRQLLPFLPTIGSILTRFDDYSEQMSLFSQYNKRKRELHMQNLSKQIPLWLGTMGILIIILSLLYVRGQRLELLNKLERDADTAQTMVEASKIKMAKYRGMSNSGFHLSSIAKKTLAPLLRDRFSADEVLLNISKSSLSGLKVQEILIRKSEEASLIDFSDSQQEPSTEMSEQQTDVSSGEEFWSKPSDTSSSKESYHSSLGAASGQTDEAQSGLDGNILIITGSVKKHSILSDFTNSLVAKGLITRYRMIKTRALSTDEFQFLLKGEMP